MMRLTPKTSSTPAVLAHEPRALITVGRDRLMAKGQKKSNKEVRKPKTEKPKELAAQPSFLTPPSKKK